MREVPGTAADRGPRCETARRLLAHPVSDRVPPSAGSAQHSGADFDAFRRWKPEYQELALEIIRKREEHPYRPFFCPRPDCDGKPHNCDDGWDFRHGRGNQHPPRGTDWETWLMLAGRGGGKTRTGAEVTHRMAKKVPRMALIAPTGPDLRETIVEGESGILVTASPDFMPEWEPSRKKLTWPNGAVALGYSGEEPDRLRGPQEYWAWLDEPAHMALIQDVWDNLQFGLRLGRRPWTMCTTTPKSSKWLKTLVKDGTTRVTSFSTYENIDNLAPSFRARLLARYEGTRLGEQELHAKILADADGALWKSKMFSYITVEELAKIQLVRIVIGIDPAGTANKKSDETGLIAAGIDEYGVIYILEDRTGKYTPSGWATEAVRMYVKWSADALVPEVNYGGDMVREVLQKNGAENIRITSVTSRRGKAIRAEPIVALYEKDPTQVKHLRTSGPYGLTELEDEQTNWEPTGKMASPNRLDALVHAATALAHGFNPVLVADPSQLDWRAPTTESAPRRAIAQFKDPIKAGALG